MSLESMMANIFGGGSSGQGGGLDTSALERFAAKSDAMARLQEEYRLKNAMVQDARRYKEGESNTFADMIEKLGPQLLQTPGLDARTASSIAMLQGIGKAAIPDLLEESATTFNQLQEGLVRGGIPSENMREYDKASKDEEYMKFVMQSRQGQVPADIQVARELNDPNLPPQYKQDLRWAHKMEKNPENVQDVAEAEALGTKGMGLIVERVGNYPKAVQSYQHVLDTTGRMIESIDRLGEAVQKDPDWVTGTFGAKVLSYLPGTGAKNFYSQKESLLSGLAMQGLEQLKSLSPTGASGFGALSEGELKVVQMELGNIDQMNKPEQVLAALGRVKNALQKIRLDTRTYKAMDDKWVGKAVKDHQLEDLMPETAPLSEPDPNLDPSLEFNARDSFKSNQETVSGKSKSGRVFKRVD
jgi:hypothetical protein